MAQITLASLRRLATHGTMSLHNVQAMLWSFG
jgi:hypothetical protein